MNDEISREALLIYLNDLRIMETIIHESDNKIKKVENERYRVKLVLNRNENFFKEGPLRPFPERSSLKMGIGALAMAVVFFIFAAPLKEFVGAFGVGIMIFFGIFCLIFSIIGFVGVQSEKDDYDFKLNEYYKKQEKFDKEMDEHYRSLERAKKNYKSTSENADKSIKELNADKNDISLKLQNAYNANIIPLQFRNIQGIYYLYDYISTSNQGLSEALMQCNLEAIKQK